MSAMARPLFLQGHIADAVGFRLSEIVAAGLAAIGGHLAGRDAAAGDVAVEHRQKALAIGWGCRFDDDRGSIVSMR